VKLYYFCSSCKKENSFTTKAKDRFELQQERGNEVNERCKYCGNITKRRINRVHANPNKANIYLGGFFGLILALILAIAIPKIVLFFLAAPVFSLPYLSWKNEEKKAHKFNNVMVDDK